MGKKTTKNIKGFSLIELLVVIAIIGLLSTLAVVSLNGARQKARDSKRMADIQQIQKAIDLYIFDKNKAPDFVDDDWCADPYSNDPTCYALDSNPTTAAFTWEQLAANLAPYINPLPKDPCGVSCYNPAGNHERGFFTYYYSAPASVYGNVNATNVTKETYAIYAENLEANEISFGHNPGSF